MSATDAYPFSGSGMRPAPLQRGLEDYDQDTLAYLAMSGVGDALLERVARLMVKP